MNSKLDIFKLFLFYHRTEEKAMRKRYNMGYDDGAQGLSDWQREDMIDEIMMRDGIVAASDYEDGFEDGREDSEDW